MLKRILVVSFLVVVPCLASAQGVSRPNVAAFFKAGKTLIGPNPAAPATYGGLWLGANADAPTNPNAAITGDGAVLNLSCGGQMKFSSGSGNVFALPASGQTISLYSGSSVVYASACDSTGSPGAATCNQGAGRAAFAAGTGAAGIVITNSLVSATSIIVANLQTSDAGCIGVKAVVPGSGSFTIYTPANCTGITNFGWVIASK